MGLFSKKKTYIESTTVSMHEELPDTVQQSILASIVRDSSISEDLIANTLYGLGTKVKGYYRYGRDSFHHGLPEGHTEVNHANTNTVKLVIEDIEDDFVVIEFSVFSKADSTFFAYTHLRSLGWDSVSNIVTGTKELQSTEWLSDTSIRIFYVDNGVVTQEDIIVPNTVRTSNYYHVGYTVGSVQKVFFYLSTDVTYDILTVTDAVKESQYFPVVPFIRDNVDLSAPNEGDPLFDTSKKLLNKIGINFENVGAGIQENPDIGAVDHAYLVVVAPIQSESVATQEYLFEYFFNLAQGQEVTKADYDSWANNLDIYNVTPPPINKIVVKETENEASGVGNYHIEFGFNYIETEIKTGVIGKKGTVTRSTVINPRGEADDFAYETSYMIWSKQVSATEYTEMRIVGLKHANHVYKDKSIDSSLEDSLSDDNDDFNIPIHRGILESMTLLRQTDVMNDSIRLCFNSIEIVKLKWYQTSIFKAIIIIVAAVITVLYDKSGTIMNWAMAITGAGAAAISTLIVAVIITAAINVLVGEALSALGAKNSAIIAALYQIYQIYQGDFSQFTGQLAIQFVSGITQLANVYIIDESHDIMNDYEQLQREQEEQQADLDALIEAYPVSTLIDPMSFLAISTSLQNQYETPDSYYRSRIHTGNIGALAFDEIEFFVRRNIKLEGTTTRGALDIL